MNQRILMISLLFSFSVFFSFSQTGRIGDCSVLRKYKLQYLDISDTSAFIILYNDSAVEYHNHGKYILRAKLDWSMACEYDMTLTELTIPNFPYRIGDVMHIQIDRIYQNIVYYTSTINGNSWEGKLKLIR